MADVRELVGDLHPMGAGALAFVEPSLGRLVFETCWSPSGPLLRQKLRDAVVSLVMPEIGRQSRRLTVAHLDLQLAEAALLWSRSATEAQRAEVERCRRRLERARAESWPRSTIESLPTLTDAAIAEIAKRNLCPCCEGHGAVLSGELLMPCANCGQRGVVPISDRKRAANIGRAEPVYRRNWRPVYEWLHGMLWDAEQLAAREFRAALGDAA